MAKDERYVGIVVHRLYLRIDFILAEVDCRSQRDLRDGYETCCSLGRGSGVYRV